MPVPLGMHPAAGIMFPVERDPRLSWHGEQHENTGHILEPTQIKPVADPLPLHLQGQAIVLVIEFCARPGNASVGAAAP